MGTEQKKERKKRTGPRTEPSRANQEGSGGSSSRGTVAQKGIAVVVSTTTKRVAERDEQRK